MITVITWDEAPMTHRYQLESFDKTLKDFTRAQQPIWEKFLILAGDYRQILPVIPRGTRAHISAASMKKAPFGDSSLKLNSLKTCELARTNPSINLTGGFSNREMETYQ